MTRLLVRLPNWIGDTVMALPALAALRQAGFDLHLIGKGWAPDLLQALPYPVARYPAGFGARVHLLRSLRGEGAGLMLLLPNSFSSALEARAAGLRPVGLRHDGRRFLLYRSLAPDHRLHQVERFWRLAHSLSARAPLPAALQGPPPAQISFPLPAASEQAAAMLQQRWQGPFVVLCPFSTGTIKGHSRLWDGFAALIARCRQDPDLAGLHWIVCPGKGETLGADLAPLFDPAASRPPGTGSMHLLPDVDLPTYAALMRAARCTLSNDSGPSHLAAAVSARQITVCGPSNVTETRPWNPNAIVLGGHGHWPDGDQVHAALRRQSLP